MTAIGDLFKAGDLTGALAAATAAVRAAPRDSGLRWLLAELMLFNGEAERADRALDAVLLEDPSPAVLEFRRLLRAEADRRQVFSEGRPPKFQGEDATPAQTAALLSLTLARQGDAEGAAAAAANAEALRPHVAGTMLRDGVSTSFDDLRDVDDVLAPQIEVVTAGGDYMWVPVERLASLEFDAPRRPRDLYWRRTTLTLKDGTEGLVFMPVIYPWADPATPALHRLGRETDWVGPEAGPIRGQGQRLLLAGEDAVALSALEALHFT